MSIAQGKYKPSVCAIDEVDDRNYGKHSSNDIDDRGLHSASKQQIEGSETAPLTTNQQKLHIDDTLTPKDLEAARNDVAASVAAAVAADAGTPNSAVHDSVNGLRGRLSFDALMRLSRKRRIMYVTTACLCALLLVIILLMIAFWPEVPFYLRAPLCLERECVQTSQQLLLWANTSKCPCHETYDWACGNFAQEYADNDYFVIKRGEWNYKTYNEYQELKELNRFISMLPAAGVSIDSVESIITSLYRSCREIDTLDKSQSDLLLKKAIKSVDGWQAFRDTNRLQYWEYKKALVHLQVIYGIFPYYKVSVENRYNEPYDYIITLDEGEIGLPDKYFYNIDLEDEVVRGYKLLLRDFAINMGIVSREADLFADDLFNYEKRIVNHIDSVKSAPRDERQLNKILRLAELKTLAPSLPIAETLQALFPHTKINEETEVLVRDVEVFQELSTIISTSDKKPINNFVVWSLVRHLLPHLSKEYRNLVENFDHAIYGRTATYPRWMICTKIVRDWLPFAVSALRLETKLPQFDFQRAHINGHGHNGRRAAAALNKTHGNDEFLRLMFFTLRNQLQASLEQAKWIDEPLRQYINKKLVAMRLQFGIPDEVLDNKTYIKDYYNELLLNNIHFVEHLSSIWSFKKARMEDKLKALNIVDIIISETFTRETPQVIAYSHVLNMLIVSRGIVTSQYYDYRYPVAVNFARIGSDILEVLIDNLGTFVAQYNAENGEVSGTATDIQYTRPDVACLTAGETNTEDLQELADSALKSFHITLSAAKVAARALSTFVTAVDAGAPIIGAGIDHTTTYESLHLTQRLRIAGLRSFNENELFTLAYMQKHCSTSIADKDYARIKPHVEQQLAERYLFNATWKHIQFLPSSTSCSVPAVRCSNIL